MPRKATTSGEAKPVLVKPKPEGEVALNDPSLYLNRELSLLAFQRRVFAEALNEANPLLERVKFLSIVGSNLDEFFMVRVSGLIEQIEAGVQEPTADGLSPAVQLLAIRREVRRLLRDMHETLDSALLPALAAQGIRIADYAELDEEKLEQVRQYFREIIYPVLTPLAFDPGRPFPHISNLSLNLAISICDKSGARHFARVKIPGSLPQLVPVGPLPKKPPKPGGKLKPRTYVWIEQIIAANLDLLFPGMQVLEAHPFHITRDADLDIKELEAEDLLESMEESVRQRRFGTVVRLKVNRQMPRHILDVLLQNLEVTPREVYRVSGLLGTSRLYSLYSLDRPDLKYKAFVARWPERLPDGEADIFEAITGEDILLHHPFDSFQPVVEFLRRAAHDDSVLAIKIVLYRVGRNSPVVQALLDAIEEGKQVAVLIELKARFDEESNIEWAKALERAGVHVVYGLVGLKSHCKAALVVRKEGDQIRRYAHLATGNYNAITAHLYTDLGLFTADAELTSDVTDLFNYLTGYSEKRDYRKLLVSPITLRQRVEALIEREIAHSKAGRQAGLTLKMNSLSDPRIIRLLYRASQAGVRVRLLVRGICCLRPGIKGLSDNIQVISIVGRFLEHSRIFHFLNGGKEEIYIGSADMMPRNLDRRVETLFPLESEALRERLKEVLGCYLKDNTNSWLMRQDGSYVRVKPGKNEKSFTAQEELLRQKAPAASRRARTKPAGSG